MRIKVSSRRAEIGSRLQTYERNLTGADKRSELASALSGINSCVCFKGFASNPLSSLGTNETRLKRRQTGRLRILKTQHVYGEGARDDFDMSFPCFEG